MSCIQLGFELRNVIALALHRAFAELHELAFRAAVLLVVHEIAAHFLDFCSRQQLLPSTQPHGRVCVRKALIVDFVCGGARLLRIRHIRKLSLDFVPLGWLLVFGEHYGTHGLRSGHVWSTQTRPCG